MIEWDEWRKQAEKKMAQAAQAERPTREELVKQRAARRLITAEELKKLQRLRKCNLRSGGMDHRFMSQFEGATLETTITERQAWYIEALWYRYRRQLGHNGKKPQGYM
jgi:hypothetical protein